MLLLAAAGGFSVVIAGPAKPDKAERKEMKEMKRDKDSADAPAGKPASDDPESRAMSRLREQMQVTDDAEWAVIGERITRVWELRRNTPSPAGALRGNAFAGGGSKRSLRTSGGSQTEQEALRSAVSENRPDAEIKMRLARLHDVSRQNEARLIKAQDDLRAVLTVRQEAVAVMAGLLPP